MKPAYSVTQVNQYIRSMFDQDYMLKRLRVEGEVSNCKYHSSGHIYFSLKDVGGTLSCVMFSGQRKGLAFRLEEGMRVIAAGSVSVYQKDGRYQLYAVSIEQTGKGELYERFLRLKEELEEMGMFSPVYKKPIPPYVRTVGVVTASTGAAIHDIETISARRNPYVQLILAPAKVQGDGAAESIARAIRRLSACPIDVMIVGRGGGSIEDLWAFNEETVARAIFECPIPVISAVGHETDTTIADYTADLRAPTPSAAAELAVFEYDAFEEELSSLCGRMKRALLGKIVKERERLGRAEKRLVRMSPESRLKDARQDLIRFEERMERAQTDRIAGARASLAERKGQLFQSLKRQTIEKKHRFAVLIERFHGLSPAEKLRQGYSFSEDADGRPLRSIRQVAVGDEMTVYLTDGRIEAEVKKEIPNERDGKQ